MVLIKKSSGPKEGAPSAPLVPCIIAEALLKLHKGGSSSSLYPLLCLYCNKRGAIEIT